MALRIEDYALIGDTEAAALVGRDGSIDWLCVPRFDAAACFAALLGGPEHGRWSIAPCGAPRAAARRYRQDTLVLETEFTTDEGRVRLIDLMPPRDGPPRIVRIVEGIEGQVELELELVIRFGYGKTVPWVRRRDDALVAIAGPDGLCLHTPVQTEGRDCRTVARFAVAAGERLPFVLSWFPSHQPQPAPADADRLERQTERYWREWCGRCTYAGRWRDEVVRSLIVLKALSAASTGGIVAAPTTSLPETLGGSRNWDYRYCWLRDATFTLQALVGCGYTDEAAAWRDWLLRAVAGDPADVQIMYGVAGERWLHERTLDWLPGYEGAQPVRVGNAASGQLQLDVYGELMDALHQARRSGLAPERAVWRLQLSLMRHLESIWREPDDGLWEVRGGRRQFTYSKVMAWVAADRAVKSIERLDAEGDAARFRRLRDDIHADVCRHGFDSDVGAFVQHYGAQRLDSSLLLVPIVGFLPPDDERVTGTLHAIRSHLERDGLLLRYDAGGEDGVDGLKGREGCFLACSFWLADCLALRGEQAEAEEVFDRLLGLSNDVGLLAEEYDVEARRQVGNFPQAFSHVGLVTTALALERPDGPPQKRRRSAHAVRE